MTDPIKKEFDKAVNDTFFGNISLTDTYADRIPNSQAKKIVIDRLKEINGEGRVSRYAFMCVIADLEATYEHYQRSGKSSESDMELSRTAMKAYSGAVDVYINRANADLPLKMPEGTILDKDLKTPAANMQAQRFDR